MLRDIQRRDCLIKLERSIQIGVLVVGAVPTPVTGVDGELREIRKPSFLRGPRSRAAGYRAKGGASK